MAEKDMQIMTRKPTHPGEVLREEFMPDYGLSVAVLAGLLAVSRQSVNEVVREKRSLSTDMALRLSRLFGTSAEYWLNLQRKVDIWNSLELHRDEFETITTLSV
ncbi:MAG: HigA family addiction module antidote protein [Coriobacteriaceae bacterium]|nr:HigA family addiction module antidote protein [Coriobacteriaceae bacterium]